MPWRTVVHIDYQTGPRGGEVWFLTLECGHHKAVSIPKFQPERDLVSLSFHGRNSRAKSREAPQRVRCLLCKVDKAA